MVNHIEMKRRASSFQGVFVRDLSLTSMLGFLSDGEKNYGGIDFVGRNLSQNHG